MSVDDTKDSQGGAEQPSHSTEYPAIGGGAGAAGTTLSSRKAIGNRIAGPIPTPIRPKSAGGKHPKS